MRAADAELKTCAEANPRVYSESAIGTYPHNGVQLAYRRSGLHLGGR
jgi:hypothetical protein